MAIEENSIGDFEVLFLEGTVRSAVREHVETLQRDGVAGTALWLTGKRGDPFQLTSKVDADDMDAARNLYLEYEKLIGADPVELVQHGRDYTATESILFAVIDVEETIRKAITAAVGAKKSQQAGAWLECTWTLVAVETG